MKIVFCLRLLAHLENNNKGGWKKASLDNNSSGKENRSQLHWTWAQNSRTERSFRTIDKLPSCRLPIQNTEHACVCVCHVCECECVSLCLFLLCHMHLKFYRFSHLVIKLPLNGLAVAFCLGHLQLLAVSCSENKPQQSRVPRGESRGKGGTLRFHA